MTGSQRQEVRQPTKSSAPTLTTQPARQPQEVDQVLSGWLAAESAFADAARTANAYAPELTATTVDPQLAWSRALLERMAASNQIATGQDNDGTPRVIALHGDRATVRTCARDAEIVVFATSGKPAPGVLGQVEFDLLTSTMVQTAAGWKLLTQAVGSGQCDQL